MSGSGILLLFLVSSLILLAMGLTLVLYVMQYQKRMMRQSEALRVQETEHQQKLLEAAVESQESERNRIASNLHDGLGALLSTIRLNLLVHAEERPESKAFAEETAALLSESIREVRNISHDLLPAVLQSHGLEAALHELADRIQRTGKIKVELATSGDAQRLPPKTELALYRVSQELANNTLRHAQAEHLTLQLAWESDHLQLGYADDGRGFKPDETVKGLGLHNIRWRTESIGGTFHFETHPGKGFSCTLSLPITQHAVT